MPAQGQAKTLSYQPQLTISKAAVFLGISPSSLRRYEKEGRITTKRLENGYRVYSKDNLESLRSKLEIERNQRKIQIQKKAIARKKELEKLQTQPEPGVIRSDFAKPYLASGLKVFSLIILSITLSLGTLFVQDDIPSFSGQIGTILGFKTTKPEMQVGSSVEGQVLADYDLNKEYEINYNIPATFFEGVTTNSISGVEIIDTTTEDTLETALDIAGEVVSTGMLSTVIADGVIDGANLIDDFEYAGDATFSGDTTFGGEATFEDNVSVDGETVLSGDITLEGDTTTEGTFDIDGDWSISGTDVDATADELNSIGGVTDTIAIIDGSTVTAGGVMFGNGSIMTQDAANFFWDDTNNYLGLGKANPAYGLDVAGTFNVDGATTLDGAVTLGDATGDDITITGYVASNVIPKTTDTYDLGLSSVSRMNTMDQDLSAADASFIGEDADDFSGHLVSSAGDVNGDGYDDILIGAAWDSDGMAAAMAGETYLILGKATGWAMDTDLSAADASFISEEATDNSGFAVSSAGDVNGDGYDDILIGAWGNDDGGNPYAGQTYLILGKATGWAMDTNLSTADASFWGENGWDRSGFAVSSAGDVNGDGYDDFVIGAWGDDDGGNLAGQAYLILGKASGWAMDTDLSAVDASFWGEAASDYAGFTVSAAGDVNGDGYDDMLVSGYGNNQVYLILGKASGWAMDTDLSAVDASFIGEGSGQYVALRTGLSSAGDVNGDGYDDILIGAAYNDDGANNAGQTYLILGKATGWAMDTNLSTADASFWGEVASDLSGYSASSAGDVNGDGYDDILIGAAYNDDGGSAAGQTYLIFGKSSGWTMDTNLSASDASFWGEDTSDYSGYSVSGAGDTNGDGYDDILIGAFGDDDGGENAGQTYLILSDGSQWDNIYARNVKAGDSLNVGAHLRLHHDTIQALSPLYLDSTRVNVLGGLTTLGYVGIGFSAPTSELHIGGTTPLLTIGDAGEEDTAMLFDGAAQDFHIGLDDSLDDLVIGTGSTLGAGNLVTIENGGNVGIGKTNPGYNLDVAGTFNVDGATTLDGAVTLGDATGDDITITGYIASGIIPKTDDTYDLGSDALRWQSIYVGPGSLSIGSSSPDEEYTLSWDATENYLGFNYNASGNPEMVIDSSGQVGIGTTAPSSQLQVAGNVVIGDAATATDYTLTFDGETNDGVLTWMENEDYLLFSDDIYMASSQIIYFDGGGAAQTNGAGRLYLTGPTSIDFSSGIGNIDTVLRFLGTDYSGVLTWMEDEDLFLFDDTIEIRGTAKNLLMTGVAHTTISTDPMLSMAANDSFPVEMISAGPDNNDSPLINWFRAKGTLEGSEADVVDGNRLGAFQARAYVGGWQPASAQMNFRVDGAPGTYAPGLIEFTVGDADNTAVTRTAFQINSNLSSKAYGNFTIGNGVATTDYTLTFDGETNDGVLTWMEDEDYFQFSDEILLLDGEKLILGTGSDGTLYSSSDDIYFENDTSDKDIIFKVNDGGVDTEVMRIDSSTPQIDFTVLGVKIGSDTSEFNPTLTFSGVDNDGIIGWMEDEDYFLFLDDILLLDGEKLILGTGSDGTLYSSSDDIYFENDTQDKDIIFKINDNGVDTDILHIDGSESWIGIRTATPQMGIDYGGVGSSHGTFLFSGTAGGGGEGISYVDSGSGMRRAISFPGSDLVVLQNRASNGTVEIRANTSTAGESGEHTIGTFEDNKITIGDGQAGVDYQLAFNGETNDGLLTWMEDEDYFQFADNIVAQNILPATDDTYDLGSDALRWQSIYVGPGSLSIGSSSPDEEYTLSWDATLNYLGFNYNASGNPEMVIDSSGQVGIGTTAPSTALDIAGTVTATDFACTDCLEQGNIANNAIGYGELKIGTGSQALSDDANVDMHEYSFFPNMEKDNCDNATSHDLQMSNDDETDNTVGHFYIDVNSSCGAGDVDVRWSYVTSSDHPTIWTIIDSLGNITKSWEAEDPTVYPDNPNPLAGTPLQSGESFAYVEPLSISQLNTIYASFPQTEYNAIFSALKQYLVDERRFLPSMSSINDLSNVPDRYHSAARFWATRFIANHYGISHSELIKNTMFVIYGDLTPQPNYYTFVSNYIDEKNIQLASIKVKQEQLDNLPINQKQADIAEYYSTGNNTRDPKPGDLISFNRKDSSFVTLTSRSYDPYLMGVISTSPHDTLGRSTEDNDIKVALTGRAPVNISPSSEAIEPGDPITSSNTSGLGTKALKPGYVVGRALESWQPDSDKKSVLVHLNLHYYDPDIMLAKSDIDLFTFSSTTDIDTGAIDFQLFNPNDTAVSKINAFQHLVSANISSGSIESEIVTADTLNIRGLTLDDYIGSAIQGDRELIEALQTEQELEWDSINTRVDNIEALLEELTSETQETSESTETPIETPSEILASIQNIFEEFKTFIAALGLSATEETGLVVEVDMNVLGDTTLGDVVVTGDILAGLIEINTLDNFININNMILLKEDGTVEAEKLSLSTNVLGTSTIIKDETKVTVETTAITTSSKVFVTPTIATDRALAVTEVNEGDGFVVEIGSSSSEDIEFNWFIVDSRE
ncbi:MerR family DNA-binding transcriptional regulator [Patescibacteria group bacterium]